MVLSPTLTWSSHIKDLLDGGNRLAQCVSWCRSERLPLHVGSSIFMTYMLPSMSWGSEFFCHSEPTLRALDRSLCRWGRHLLGWPSGSPPCAGVLVELGWPDSQRLCLGRLLSLLGRTTSMAGGPGYPLPVAILHIASQVPGTWPVGLMTCVLPQMHLSLACPVCSLVLLSIKTRRWFDSHILLPLESALRSRVLASAFALTAVHLPPAAISVSIGPHPVI